VPQYVKEQELQFVDAKTQPEITDCFHNIFCIFCRYHMDKDHSCQPFSILLASAD